MAIDHVQAKRSAAQLAKATDAVDQIMSDPKKRDTEAGQQQLNALEQQIKAAQGDLVQALGGTPPATANGVPSSFDQFFSAVASSFANAQENLDRKTKEYLASIQNQQEFPPTAFRIAKVSADMKFAVESVDEESVGVIFFKDTSSSDVQNQQEVHFEIVAAPTPPGSKIASPSISLLFSARKRKQVFDAVATFNVAGDKTGSASLLSQPNRVLIFTEEPDESFYLAYADGQQCGLWRLERGDPKLTVMRTFASTVGTDLDLLRGTLLQFGTQQESFLNSIG
jgi:hypothetical protein